MKIIHYITLSGILWFAACKKPDSYANLLADGTGKDYPAYGGNKANTRYSSLDQITPDNVNQLKIAWSYFANNPPDTGRPRSGGEIQCQPIVVHGVLYGTSAELNLFALDAATGTELWKFTPPQENLRRHASRGVMHWESGEDQRIYYTAGYHLYCIDAGSGKIINSFGDSGRVDLHAGLGENLDHEVNKLHVTATSPGIIFKNTLVIGSSVSEGGDAAPGHIRAFDVNSGKLKWVFRTIPQPGDPGYETWPPDAWKKFGGVNNWSGMSLDEKRGLVYFGTGSPSSDYYGGDREGANLYGNCVIALEAETGKLKWYFQAIRHDLWDRDFPCPPNLATITQNGKKREVVVQAGKDGYIYVLDRDTGESVFPLEEHPVPVEGLPGEHPYPSQITPAKPRPLIRQLFTEADITDISPESHAFVKKRLQEFPPTTNRHQPPREAGTILFGYSGGAEWGGGAVDPEGILYQNANEAPWELTMIDKASRDKETATLSPGHSLYLRNCAACHGADRRGNSNLVPTLVDIGKKRSAEDIASFIQTGNARMPAFIYLSEKERKALAAYLLETEGSVMPAPRTAEVMKEKNRPDFPYEPPYMIKVWQRFVDQNGYNAVNPPWGTLNAIDLNTGEYLWRVPLGEFPELTQRGIPVTGTETYGGPVVTAGGLVFIASTRDERIRAFDKRTGKVLWEYQLPAGGFATPITYEVSGKQYIALAVGGGRGAKPGGWYMAFSL
ncbi:MAG TPA: PQQ-binding-like beta-propeller repeat protein [Saprospiraceae bacterium]|nr:PQQ-binding-like beta-propeller repeat protein [Saprospiraceae bacterium]HNT20545.1 PQQ-binding-like beta-propeller repeat protein [Saprospiraceae bacterium]